MDRIVYVSRWGRDALLDWFPEAEAVPSAVIGNFVAPLSVDQTPSERRGDLVTVGNLEAIKNHAYLLASWPRRSGRGGCTPWTSSGRAPAADISSG